MLCKSYLKIANVLFFCCTIASHNVIWTFLDKVMCWDWISCSCPLMDAYFQQPKGYVVALCFLKVIQQQKRKSRLNPSEPILRLQNRLMVTCQTNKKTPIDILTGWVPSPGSAAAHSVCLLVQVRILGRKSRHGAINSRRACLVGYMRLGARLRFCALTVISCAT